MGQYLEIARQIKKENRTHSILPKVCDGLQRSHVQGTTLFSGGNLKALRSLVLGGSKVRVWSKEFQDWIYVVYGEHDRRAIWQEQQGAVIYSLDELSWLERSDLSAKKHMKDMQLIQKVKSIFNAKIVRISEQGQGSERVTGRKAEA